MAYRNIKHKPGERGQAALLGIMMIMVFVGLFIGMVDVYHLLEARNWTYQAAQRAAADGVTTGINLTSGVIATGGSATPCVGQITLNTGLAESTARSTMNSYLNDRAGELEAGSVTLYVYARNTPGDYVVFPDLPARGYPNNPARDRLLSSANTRWTVAEPSVAVAGIIPVKTFLGSFIGLPKVDVTFFAATSVHQPANVCP